MKVSGFSFVRNAIKYDYPVVASIKSILPLCDEFVIAVGKSEDNTLELIKGINSPKLKIIETIWDDSLREGGRVLAVETNKAFMEISKDSDWAFYIQADEVMYEKHLDVVYDNMKKYKDIKEIDGLLFNYLHFYGSYDYIATSSKWYKHEIRIIRNDKRIYSYKDAQGFRKKEDEKLNVVPLDAWIYHYGWVKHPSIMQRKQSDFNKLWHSDEWVEKKIEGTSSFNYQKHITKLELFKGTHPSVMQGYVNKKNWKFDYDISMNKETFKDKFKRLLLKTMGIDFSYKNYKIIKP